MPRVDSLVFGATLALKKSKIGSQKTRYNDTQAAKRFAETIRDLNYGVKKWANVSNKHVGEAIDRWLLLELSPGTIKNYLSSVRKIAALFGNDSLHKDNSTFGVPMRKYVTNADKAVPEDVFKSAVDQLKNSLDPIDHRIAAQLQLERTLGLRTEESAKFDPKKDLLHDGRVLISRGTKGGRERMIHDISPQAREAIDYASKQAKGHKCLIPKEYKYFQWRNKFYKKISAVGISGKESGASSHGLRHAYAQERYEQIAGFQPRCKFESLAEFKENARLLKGENWEKLDQSARMILKGELGHGPERDDVVNSYLGSSYK